MARECAGAIWNNWAVFEYYIHNILQIWFSSFFFFVSTQMFLVFVNCKDIASSPSFEFLWLSSTFSDSLKWALHFKNKQSNHLKITGYPKLESHLWINICTMTFIDMLHKSVSHLALLWLWKKFWKCHTLFF